MTPRAAAVHDLRVLWDMLDGPVPRGVLGLSDPTCTRSTAGG